jgi:hypothetical protein
MSVGGAGGASATGASSTISASGGALAGAVGARPIHHSVAAMLIA